MSVGVFTRMKRVKFVSGWETGGTDPADGSVECGDGTAYPLEVTPAQLAEIFYRVKDSKLTGSVTETFDGTVNIIGFSGTPDAALVSGVIATDWDWFVQRGYSTDDVTGFSGMFGSVYTASGGYAGSGSFYDVAADERAMWIPDSAAVDFNGPTHWRTGFSHLFNSTGTANMASMPSWYLAYHDLDGYIFGASASLIFNGRVAWLDDNSSGNPFDPANRLFIGLEFTASDVAYAGLYQISTNNAVVSNTLTTGSLFELELSNSVVLSCPFFCSSNGSGITYSGNIRAVATEWWPYAKAGGAVWNTGTGAKI